MEQYKTIYGKSVVDQALLIPEEYQSLTWFLFPSEVLPDLLELKFKSPLSFETLEKFNQSIKLQEDEEWTTPYQPRDYNTGEFKFQFSEEYQ